MENLRIREFQKAIEDFIDASDIALEVKRMVLADILRNVEAKTTQQLLIEIAERDKEEKQNAESV